MKQPLYLEDLLGSKMAIGILRVLIRHKNKAFMNKNLSKYSGVSEFTIPRLITMFEKFGIVSVQTVGKSRQILLNEDSYYLNTIIEPIFTAEGQIPDTIITILKKYLSAKPIISAGIHTSNTHKKQKNNIDVFIISKSMSYAMSAVKDANQEIFLKFHINISPLIFSKSEFKSKTQSKFVMSVLDDHTLICGKTLKSVLR